MNNKVLLEAAEKFGTPLYIYDSNMIKSQYNRLKQSFKNVKNLQINYAVKALSNISILKYMINLGSGIDAVSIQEVKLALKAGVNPKKILYTPNGVSIEEIKEEFNFRIVQVKRNYVWEADSLANQFLDNLHSRKEEIQTKIVVQ